MIRGRCIVTLICVPRLKRINAIYVSALDKEDARLDNGRLQLKPNVAEADIGVGNEALYGLWEAC